MRLVHLGLGNFFRAHQAWYTHHANLLHPGDPWRYSAFTGRLPGVAAALAASDGAYTLVTRAAGGDSEERITAIAAAHDGADAGAWQAAFADPELAVVTLTVTEAGYDPAGSTAPARIVAGLASRRAAGGGPLALVSCDNLSGNGEVLRRAVASVAAARDDDLADWIAQNARFANTMVDRITPAGPDPLTVITEPFSEWVIAGEFPAGRPAWHEVGVRFVADVAPYERRKLWLLNAAHSTLAYLGLLRGAETVADAFADDGLRAAVEQLWAEVRPVLGFADDETDAALAALRTRFANPRIAHRLAQIALNGREKLAQRQQAIMAARTAIGLDPGTVCRATVAAYDELIEKGIVRAD